MRSLFLPAILAALPIIFFPATEAFAQSNMGPSNIPQINSTIYVGAVPGFNANIQKAVSAACSMNHNAQITIPAGYAGSDSISSVTSGCAGAYISDERSVSRECYAWSGSSYTETSCTVGGGGGATIPPTTVLLKGTSVGNAATPAGPSDVATLLSQLTGCTSPSMVYSPGAGQCIAAGSGGSPAGSVSQFQVNLNGSAFGATGFGTDTATRSDILGVRNLSAKMTNGTANASQFTGGAATYIQSNPSPGSRLVDDVLDTSGGRWGYIDNGVQFIPTYPVPTMFSVDDVRNGADVLTSFDPGPSAATGVYAGRETNCSHTQLAGDTGGLYLVEDACAPINFVSSTPGWNYGFSGADTGNMAGSLGYNPAPVGAVVFGQGIKDGPNYSMVYLGAGDENFAGMNAVVKPAFKAPSDEGTHTHRDEVSEAIPISGVVASGSTVGANVIHLTSISAGDGPGVGHPLIDKTTDVLSCTSSNVVGNGSGPGTVTLSGCTVPTSTTMTLNAAIDPGRQPENAGVLTTFTATAGTVCAPGSLIAIEGTTYSEFPKLISSTLSGGVDTMTAILRYPHGSGVTVDCGGMAGRWMEQTNYTFPNVRAGQQPMRYLFEVYGSPTSSTIKVGEQTAGHIDSGYLQPGPVTIYHGAIVTDVRVPGMRTPDGSVMTVADDDTFAAGDAVEEPNSLSAHYDLSFLVSEMQNPYATSASPHYEAFDGRVGALNPDAYYNIFEKSPCSTYVTCSTTAPLGMQAKPFMYVQGNFQSGIRFQYMPQGVYAGGYGSLLTWGAPQTGQINHKLLVFGEGDNGDGLVYDYDLRKWTWNANGGQGTFAINGTIATQYGSGFETLKGDESVSGSFNNGLLTGVGVNVSGSVTASSVTTPTLALGTPGNQNSQADWYASGGSTAHVQQQMYNGNFRVYSFGTPSTFYSLSGTDSSGNTVAAVPFNFNLTPYWPTPAAGDSSQSGATTQFVQNALNAISAPVASIFGRTGAVTSSTGDYTVSQVTGAAPIASPALTGTPTAPTGTCCGGGNQIATQQFAINEVLAQSAVPTQTNTFTAVQRFTGVVFATRTIGAGTSLAVSATDYTLRCDASAGAVTIVLPSSPITGQVYVVKKVDTSANACTVTAGGTTLDGATSNTLSSPYASITAQFSGSTYDLM
jgi:hypothetical protein